MRVLLGSTFNHVLDISSLTDATSKVGETQISLNLLDENISD